MGVWTHSEDYDSPGLPVSRRLLPGMGSGWGCLLIYCAKDKIILSCPRQTLKDPKHKPEGAGSKSTAGQLSAMMRMPAWLLVLRPFVKNNCHLKEA